jgi:hypothetical protein
MIYAHAVPESQKRAVDKVAEILFPSFCRYRKWKDALIDVEEVARKMEPRARVELATCRLRIESFSSISFAVYLRPSLSFAPFAPVYRPHVQRFVQRKCAQGSTSASVDLFTCREECSRGN